MITVEDIREELNDPNLDERHTQKVIDRMKQTIIDYTNNPNVFTVDEEGVESCPLSIEDVWLYLVCERLNPEKRGRQGLESVNEGGMSYTFLTDIPQSAKSILNKYRKAKWY
jgi:hypothetical protein